MKFKKLNMLGFSHDLALVVFVAIFSIAGVGYVVASRAASCPRGQYISGSQCVPAVPIISIVTSPETMVAGQSSVITWSTTYNPTSCSATGSWSGAKMFSGSQNTGILATPGIYTYGLSCVNSNGASTNYATVTVISKDTTPPSAPTNITGTFDTSGHITLKWTSAKDNIGVKSYKVVLAGWGTVANVPGPTATLNSAVNGTTYTYTVKAVDAAGNISADSVPFSITPKF